MSDEVDKSLIEQFIKDYMELEKVGREEAIKRIIRRLSEILYSEFGPDAAIRLTKEVSEAAKEGEPLRDRIYKWYRAAVMCIMENESILDLLPWSRQLIDTANTWLSFHRANVLGDLIRKVPEPMRSRVLPVMMSSRFELSQFSYVSEGCMDTVMALISEASKIVLAAAARYGVNRYVVGAARIISILSRAASKDGFYLDRRALIGLIRELYVNVSALI